MPVKIGSVNTDQPATIKKAIEEIARSGLSLQKPSEGDELYLLTIPTVSDLSEGQLVFYFDGGTTYRLYTKINNVIRYIALV